MTGMKKEQSLPRLAVIAYHSSPLLEPGSGDAGGMTVYIRAVASALAARGLRTDCFTRSITGRTEVRTLEAGVRVIALPVGPPGPLPKEQLSPLVSDFVDRIVSFAPGRDYDLIHSHYWQSGLAGIELAGRWKVPLVHSQHTLGRVKDRYRPPNEAIESVTRIASEDRIVASADVLIASTDDEWGHLACLYKASHDRLKTVYPGVDHSRFSAGDRSEARRRLGLAQDAAVLLCVGRIQPLKGLGLAVEALGQLGPVVDRPVQLLVLGGASGRSGAREIDHLKATAVRAGVADRVSFLGPVPHEATPDHYRAADVVLVCSYSESFGLSALEAQACGIPVVATDVGGLSHVVVDGRSGFLTADRDASVFAGHIKTLLADDDMTRLFSNAALASARRFTWERTATELQELYECLVTERLPEACTC